MSIPRYFEVSRPLLAFMAKNPQEHTLREIYETMGKFFKLSAAELSELLPGGSQSVFENRVGWAKQDLYWAGLIARVRHGVYKVTKEGLRESKNSCVLDRAYLSKKYSSITEKLSIGRISSKKVKRVTRVIMPFRSQMSSALTPDENISQAIEQRDLKLSSDLLETIAKMQPFKFERLVFDLVVAMGYGDGGNGSRVTQKSNDEGVDAVINQDPLGLDVIYLQAKRWQNDIGRKEIQSFVGALAGKHASKGVFITTSSFCKTALDYVKNVAHKVILIDGENLARLMIKYNVGVSVRQTVFLKRIDSDYFDVD